MPWKDRISKALAGEDGYSLKLALQPIVPVDFSFGVEPNFYEVLIRLVNPDGGIASAGEFIDSIMLDNALMEKLDWWVLKATAERISKTKHTYAVNLGASILRSPYFVQALSNMLRASDATVAKLAIEVTEREMLHGQEIDNLKMLVRNHAVFLDDVGSVVSRHSLFSYFASDFVSGLKLDINLVSQVNSNWRALRIIENMIDLCEKLDFICICEGVEDLQVLSTLRKIAADRPSAKLYVQGYFVGRPQC